jgi:cytochrome c biogenesis protein CcmG/thiol:disulfide interchange protein DsbE
MGTERAKMARTSPLARLPRLLGLGAIALFLALLAYGVLNKGPDNTIQQRLDEGRSAPAPAFSLEVLELGSPPPQLRPKVAAAAADRELSLEELRGTPVVLNLWASWCSPCEEEAPRLEQGWRQFGPRGVLFLGLDQQDLRGDARGFLRDFKITYPTIREPGREVARSYGATGIPETYFISKTSRVVAHVIGVASGKQLLAGISAAVSGRPLGSRKGGALRPPR